MISEWFDYDLQDFLLFSPETYWRLFELQNKSLWPAQVVVLAGLMALVFASLAGWRRSGAAIGVGLAICWGVAAQTFLAARYEPINWVIGYAIPLFWGQAVLMALLAPRLVMERAGRASRIGLAVAAVAIAYPALGIAAGRPIVQAEVAGLAPDPTALVTLGILALARPGWRAWVLAIVPAAWISASIVTLLTMGAQQGWLLAAIFGTAVLALLRRQRGT